MCHGILLSNKEQTTGISVSVDKRCSWAPEYTPHVSVHKKANSRQISSMVTGSRKWLGKEAGLLGGGTQELSGGDENVLHLVLDGGYTGVYSYRNSVN